MTLPANEIRYFACVSGKPDLELCPDKQVPASLRLDAEKLQSFGTRGHWYAPAGGDGYPLRSDRWRPAKVTRAAWRVEFPAGRR